ncbi:MAG: alkaline phosphatase family protein [Rhodothermales bacterium]|nr:alkaline phosphatase family protein [Rhodothermales bacterium]
MNQPLRKTLLVMLLALVSVSCGSLKNAGDRAAAEPSPLILVSIDGFRWDYTDIHQAPTIDSLARSGVRSEGLIPPFPSKTFPSHYTQVTGLHPAKHGIVSNTMYDPGMDASFRLSDNEAQLNPEWWSGEPIWVTATKNDLVSACMFWPGSETEHDGYLPDMYKAFDGDLSSEDRVNQLLAWMALPEDERPDFATLYFDIVDSAGHRHGPQSKQVHDAVLEVDASIRLLVSGLKAQGIKDPNIVLVSDHGMAEIDTTRVIFLDDYIDMTDVRIVDWSPIAALRPPADMVDEVYEGLLNKHPELQVYRGGDEANLPERFHYSDNDRIQPVIAVASEGWTITIRDGYRASRHLGSTHGYDNHLQSMHGLFAASGPAFKSGVVIPAVESIHLYNMMAAILSIDPAPNDGGTVLIDSALAVER